MGVLAPSGNIEEELVINKGFRKFVENLDICGTPNIVYCDNAFAWFEVLFTIFTTDSVFNVIALKICSYRSVLSLYYQNGAYECIG